MSHTQHANSLKVDTRPRLQRKTSRHLAKGCCRHNLGEFSAQLRHKSRGDFGTPSSLLLSARGTHRGKLVFDLRRATTVISRNTALTWHSKIAPRPCSRDANVESRPLYFDIMVCVKVVQFGLWISEGQTSLRPYVHPACGDPR